MALSKVKEQDGNDACKSKDTPAHHSATLQILLAMPLRFLNSSALVLLGLEVSDMSAAIMHTKDGQ